MKGRQLAAAYWAITSCTSLSLEESRQLCDSIKAANQGPHLPEILTAQNISDAWLAGFHAGGGDIQLQFDGRQGLPLDDAWTRLRIRIRQGKSLAVLQEIQSRYGGERQVIMICHLCMHEATLAVMTSYPLNH